MPFVSLGSIKMKKSFITILIILTSGHSVECFSDTCDYSTPARQFLCGDICLNNTQPCYCGGQNVTQGGWGKHCCAPASACNGTQWWANCSSGEVLSWRSPTPCNTTGRCFNDVLTSQNLHYNYAKYTCQDKCIDWDDMCQGVSHCAGDEEACGPELRCPPGATRHNMSTIPIRYFCYDDDEFGQIKNTGVYELLDRTDEELSVSTVTSGRSINYTALAPCTFSDGDVGVKCDGGVCLHTAIWCNEKWGKRYCKDSRVMTTDPRLCSQPTFWQEKSCNYTYRGHIFPGVRCTGAIKHCYYPKGSPDEDYYPTTCRDKSDRVFQVGEPCPETPDNICQESCDTPGPGCPACGTNTTYFQCAFIPV